MSDERKQRSEVIISDKALIPVGMLAGIIAAVFFLGGFVSEQRAHGEAIKRLEDQYASILYSINTRLSTIEGRMGIDSPPKK